MKTRKRISREVMEKTWLMHEKSVDTETISVALDISEHSVFRIVSIMEKAAKGDVIGMKLAFGCQNYINQKMTACEIFGLDYFTATRPTAEEYEQTTIDEHITEEPKAEEKAEYTPFEFALLSAVDEINIRLSRICEKLGVE